MFGIHKIKRKAVERKVSSTVEWNYLRYIMEKALPDLKRGRYNVLGNLYSIFMLEQCEHQQIEVINALIETMSQQTSKRVLQLENGFRQIDYMSWRVTEHVDWESLDLSRERFRHFNEEQYGWLLKLGTFYSSGYCRQKCMEMIVGKEDSLPYLILRLNDWVEPVRKCAFNLIKEQIKQCSVKELCISLAYFQRMQNAGRRNPENMRLLEEWLKTAVSQNISQIFIKEILGYEVFVRNAVYRFLGSQAILSREEMEQLIQGEKDGLGKRLLIQGILNLYECTERDIHCYLKNKSAVVRRYVVNYQYECVKNAWQGLEELLMDSSKYIREYVSFILGKHTDISILEYYLAGLERENSKIAILGVGEHGTVNEIEVIRPYLKSSEEGIVKAALVAMGNLAGVREDAVYWQYLNDERLTVAKQAYIVIRKLQIHYGAEILYESYCGKKGLDTCRYFLKLLMDEPSWKRLPYLLKLYNIEDPDMRDKVRKHVQIRNMYATVTKNQEQHICNVLEEMGDDIPESVKGQIELDLKYVCRNRHAESGVDDNELNDVFLSSISINASLIASIQN